MSELGKRIRMERIVNRKDGNTLIVPMDHGTSMGPIRGLESMPRMVDAVADGGADAVLVHKGIARAGHRGYGRDVGLIIHITASTNLAPDPLNKVQVATVQEVVKMGADAVSVHVNVGAEEEGRMLRELGEVSRECMEWGMPLIAMMYPRGKKIKSEHDPEHVKHVARLGAELGADIIKVPYTGDPETFADVVKGCPVPVVIAGGPKADSDSEVLEMVRGAMEAGAKGASIGRNIFQHPDPEGMTRAIARVVHGTATVKEALKEIKKQ